MISRVLHNDALPANRYVSFSGGADSTATALLLWERKEPFELIFADTGAEFPETYHTILKAAKFFGKRPIVVSGGSFLNHLSAHAYYMPSNFARWCTKSLKVVPLNRYIKKEDICYVGIRADEPRRFNFKSGYTDYEVQMPLIAAGYGKKEVKEICAKYDLLNPLYSWRTNVSCFCCFFQRVSDWRGMLQHHPELYALAEQWEDFSNEVSKKGKDGAGYLIHKEWSLKNLRRAKESQLTLFPECEEEPCLICQAS